MAVVLARLGAFPVQVEAVPAQEVLSLVQQEAAQALVKAAQVLEVVALAR